MRAATIALTAIPVVFGGLGLAAVAGALDPLIPPTPAAEESQVSPTPEPRTESDTGTNTGSGTPIDGRRPHLSVIDGRANLILPAPIPAFLSLLPFAPIELSPLPRAGAEAPPADSAAVSADSQHDPGAASGQVADHAGPAFGRAQTAAPSSPTSAGPASTVAPSSAPVPPAHNPPGGDTRPRPSGEPWYNRESLALEATDRLNQAIPPHAGPGNLPAHSGPGKADHDRDDHSQGRGNSNSISNSKADHSHGGSRPVNAGGYGLTTDNGRPGSR